MEIAVIEYFHRGYQYEEILAVLRSEHQITLSIRNLHRILRRLGLYRKRNYSPLHFVIAFIENELKGSRSSLGYRQMHQLCHSQGLNVPRRVVALIQKILDPEGVELRRRNRLRRRQYLSLGPNYVWHIDGYDKLKPYGFPIHGAIDGFSRYILWLNVCQSNKDPKIVCSYFLNHVDTIKAAPRKVVADRGTENVYICASQRFFRQSEEAFQYGRSISNQRIESWWAMLRRFCTNWWINFFQDLVEQGIYDLTDPLHVECIQFCFGSLLQNDLEKIKQNWNHHRIRQGTHTHDRYRPSGIPSVIYSTPTILDNDTNDYKSPVIQFEIDAVKEVCCTDVNRYICSDEFYTLANIVIFENNLRYPNNCEEGLRLFLDLCNYLNQI